MSLLAFRVHGLPVPQGSLRAFVRGGRPIVTAGNRQTLGAWRQAIAAAALEAGAKPIAGPVSLELVFSLPRPKGRRKRDQWPDRRPDSDKLARAALDALTGVGYDDDAQVCALIVWKQYGSPGLDVSLRALEGTHDE